MSKVIVGDVDRRSEAGAVVGVWYEFGGKWRADLAMWFRAIQRGEFECGGCARTISKGESSFRPLGRRQYSDARLCGGCAE